MVRPAQRRAVVDWARSAHQVTERRACRMVGVRRSVYRYRSVRPKHEALRQRMRELASVRVRSGYRQLHILLQREGWQVNQKRIYRLYSEEGLTLKRTRPKRHRTAAVRLHRSAPVAPNEQWAMDFMHDTLAAQEPIRVLTVIDLCTRECVALVAAKRFSGSDVARLLGEAAAQRGGLASRIRVDNGTEFTSKALDHWAYWNRVQLQSTRQARRQRLHRVVQRDGEARVPLTALVREPGGCSADAGRLPGGLQQHEAPPELGQPSPGGV
jgi:putative transposase